MLYPCVLPYVAIVRCVDVSDWGGKGEFKVKEDAKITDSRVQGLKLSMWLVQSTDISF